MDCRELDYAKGGLRSFFGFFAVKTCHQWNPFNRHLSVLQGGLILKIQIVGKASLQVTLCLLL